ncbi:hypothetical protein J1N35_014070, partial [Gossypium stocksii]
MADMAMLRMFTPLGILNLPLKNVQHCRKLHRRWLRLLLRTNLRQPKIYWIIDVKKKEKTIPGGNQDDAARVLNEGKLNSRSNDRSLLNALGFKNLAGHARLFNKVNGFANGVSSSNVL